MEICPECGRNSLRTRDRGGAGAAPDGGSLPKRKIKECYSCGYRSDLGYTVVFDAKTGTAVVEIDGGKFVFHVGVQSYAEVSDDGMVSRKGILAQEARKIIESHHDNDLIEPCAQYRFEFHNRHFYNTNEFGISK